MKSNPLRRVILGALFGASLTAQVACSSAPKPQALEQATRQLGSAQAADLGTLQPKLLRDAKEAELLARRAYDEGDLERASLYARLALSRYRTAEHFVGRRASAALVEKMRSSREGLAQEAQRLAVQRQELDRYAQLDQSFQALEQRLGELDAAQTGDAAKAKRALTKARAMQAEALGLGGASVDGPRYAQGRLLVESALEALERGLYPESAASAAQASSIFEQVIAAARRSEDGQRALAQRDPDGVAQPVQRAPDEGQRQAAAQAVAKAQANAQADREAQALKQEARQAVDEALLAQEQALTLQMNVSAPGLYERGVFLLQTAERRLSAQDFQDASAKARAARALFLKAEQRVTPALAARPQVSASTPLSSQLEEGTSAPAHAKPQRAAELADKLLALELAKIDAIGALVPERCPGEFRAFEATLALAKQRLDAGDLWRAFELMIRAEDRLKRCDLAAPAPDAKGAAQERAAQQQRVAAREQAQQRALSALSQAQGAHALFATRYPDAPEIKEAAQLIVNAQAWLKQGHFTQAQEQAALASKRLDAVEVAANAKPLAPPKDQGAAERCAQAQAAWELAQGAKLRAASAQLEPGPAVERFNRAVAMVSRAQTWITLQQRDRCDDAEFLAREATLSFEALLAPPAAAPEAPAAVASSRQREDERPVSAAQIRAQIEAERDLEKQETLAMASISKAKLWMARVEGERDAAVYKTAAQLLSDAQRRVQRREWGSAAALAEQAAGAFASLEQSAARADAAEEAAWKPAYAKVIDALTARDEAAPMIGDAERVTFEQGLAHLKRARMAWDSKEFFVSGKFADSALASFEQAAAAATARAAREAKQAERDAQEAQAKAAQTAKEEAATRAALEAKAQAKAAQAAQAKADAEAKEEAARQRRLEAQARDAMRNLSVAYELCQRERCERRDAEAWLKAKLAYEDAQAAVERRDYQRAMGLATAAQVSLDQAKAAPLPFSIPSTLSRVTRVGDRLVVEPKLAFSSGGADLTAESIKGIDELAVVLKDNAALIERVELVGFTDNRGKREANVKLSAQRAQAVKEALIRQGVDAQRLAASGLGPDQPAADNRTAAGREANRRVEVRLILKGR